jgi:Protein of unknown function (DUF3307)
MYEFYRLLFAHFLADFPLQLNAVYRLKVKGRTGIFLHVSIFFIIALTVMAPLLLTSSWRHRLQLIILIFFVTATHFFIDYFKLSISQKGYDNILYFFADQLVHVCSIALVIPFSYGKPIVDHEVWWQSLYNNDALFIYLIGFVLSTFGGFIVAAYLGRLFFKELFITHQISEFKKYLGMLVGLAVTGSIVFIDKSIYLIPCAALITAIIIIYNKAERKFSAYNVLFTIVYAAVIGAVLKVCTNFLTRL